jgi:hypothetical protein
MVKRRFFHTLLLRILLRQLIQLSDWMTVVRFPECVSFFAITSTQARPTCHNQDWSDKAD